MSTISCTIGGTPVTIKNNSVNLSSQHSQRSILSLTVEDSTGTLFFLRGQQIVFSDSVLGIEYTGWVQTALPQRLAVNLSQTYQEIIVTTMDNQYLPDKRTNELPYVNFKAGDIVADFIETTLASEGVIGDYALEHDSTITDFATGLLTNTTSIQTPDGITGDGQLQLAPSGADFTYSESTTANFATGTLTNCVAANNTLLPTSTKALKMVSTLNSGNVGNTVSSMKLWTGSVAMSGSNIYLNYDIFIDPSSPQATASINITFSDGTSTSLGTNDLDGQGLDPSTTIDLTGLATTTWYNRGFAIGADFGGKTAVSASLDIAGTTPGTYTVYIRRANFSNALFINQIVPPANVVSYIFDTTLLVSPPQQLQFYGYVDTTLTVVDSYELAPTYVLDTGQLYRQFTQDFYDNSQSNRLVGPISVGSVKALKGSFISWNVVEPDKTVLAMWYSLDDQNFIRCTNNASLPNLPAGFDLTGKNIYLSYQFFQLPGANVEDTPVLSSLTLTLNTSFPLTKTDLSYTVRTQANWNTGTLTNLVSNTNNEIALNGVIRFWDNGNFSRQDVFASSTFIRASTYNRANRVFDLDPTAEGTQKNTFAGTSQNFTVEVDMQVPATTVEAGLIYRQTNFGSGANNFAYLVTLCDTRFELGRGSNSSSSGTGTYTIIATKSIASKVGSWHRVKAVVNGSSHKASLDDVQHFSNTDSTFSAAGYTGLHLYNPTANTVENLFDNFGVVAALSGTWVSPGTSLTSIGNYGTSVISWRDKSQSYNGGTNTTVLVEASYDNGSTYATCTNNSPLPTLTAGTSLSGKTLKIRITLSSTTAASLAALDNLVVRVLGDYGTISGTRSTFPLGIDTFNRANASGTWGTSSDSQSYTKGGTGTVNIASNTGTITTTTGNVTMRLGSGTGTDLEDTVDLKLSAGSDIAGTMLRYVDSTHYYKLVTTGTTISLVKNVGSGDSTLASASVSLSTGTFYTVRYRVKDSGTVHLYGKIWQTGTTEPGTIVYGEVDENNPMWTLTATDTGTTNASGGYGLVGNSTSGTVTFDNLRITQFPDPSLNLSTVGRIGSTGVNWTAITPGSSTVAVVTSTDGFTTNSATSGGSITGPFPQSDPVIDTFNTNTSANYTNTNRTGGSVATVTYTTASSRLALSGGTNGIYTYNAIVKANIDISVTMDQSDAGGLVWCFNDASNFYYLQIGDSASSVAANTLTLAKVVANTRTQLATSSISFPTLTRVIALRVTMGDGIINVYYESATPLFTVTDNDLGAGKMGLYNTTGSSRYYQARFVALGDDMTRKWLYHKTTLATSSADISPIVIDQLFSMRGPLMADGATIPALHSEKNPFKSYYSVEMSKLTQLSSNSSSDFYWDVDQNRKMIFTNRQTQIAPRCINTIDLLYTPMVKPTFSAQLYRNRQSITNCTGTKIITGEQKITDGSSTSWQLQYPVYEMTAITVGGVTKTFGQQGIDSGKDFYWQADSVSISQDPSAPRIAKGTIISVDYTGQFVTTVTRDNTSEQTARAAIETNTSGIVEAWEDGLGMLVAQATTYADGLLARYANNGTVEVVVQTRDGSYAQGMLTSFFLPESNVFDQNLTITKIVTRPTQRGDGNVDYTYEITATNGPNLNRWASVLGY